MHTTLKHRLQQILDYVNATIKDNEDRPDHPYGLSDAYMCVEVCACIDAEALLALPTEQDYIDTWEEENVN